MSKAATSIRVFGVYLSLIGISFLVVPNVMLGLFGFPTTTEPWIRIVGLLALILSYYYIRSASFDLTEFFHLTVHARMLVIVVFAVMVVLDFAQPMLILFGVVDLAGALWTAWALRTG